MTREDPSMDTAAYCRRCHRLHIRTDAACPPEAAPLPRDPLQPARPIPAPQEPGSAAGPRREDDTSPRVAQPPS